LLHLYNPEETITVIIDVFRATSTIVAALDNGASRVIPVSAVDECIRIGKEIENSITAGERDGKVAEGLQHGNSPLEYPKEFIQGKTLVLTTSSGTRLLHMVKGADSIVIGSFLNLTAICKCLIAQQKPVLLGCAAWKDRFNLEDTLFAGAVVNRVAEHFSIQCDSARAARTLEAQTQGKYLEYLKDSSHYHRLAAYGLLKDLEYCITPDLHPVVPILNGNELIVNA
jgi:2-phosphosulfolactate phosphatase